MAIGRNRKDLRGIGHFGQHGIGAGVEADDGRTGPPRFRGRAGRAGGEEEGSQNNKDPPCSRSEWGGGSAQR